MCGILIWYGNLTFYFVCMADHCKALNLFEFIAFVLPVRVVVEFIVTGQSNYSSPSHTNGKKYLYCSISPYLEINKIM